MKRQGARSKRQRQGARGKGQGARGKGQAFFFLVLSKRTTHNTAIPENSNVLGRLCQVCEM